MASFSNMNSFFDGNFSNQATPERVVPPLDITKINGSIPSFGAPT